MAETTQNRGTLETGNAKKESLKKDVPKTGTPKTGTFKTGASKTGKGSVAKKSKKHGARRTWMWLAVAVVLIGGTVAAGWPVIGPWASGKFSALVNKTRDGVTVKGRPVSEPRGPIQTRTPAVTQETLPTPTPILARRMDDLEARMRALKGANDTGAPAELKAQVAALAARVGALEEAQARLRAAGSAQAASAQALILAATQLRARLESGDPYGEALTALKKIAPKNADVAELVTRLLPYATTGAPRRTDLTARYAHVARAIIRARAKAEAADQGWFGRLKAGLGGLITVRRTDPASIRDKVERAVAVAQRALQRGKLNDAVAALSVLQGPPGAAVAPWLRDARARLDAQSAAEKLYRLALVALSATGGA